MYNQSWKIRYQKAHELWFKQNTPSAYSDGFYSAPKYPDVKKSGGLTLMICNYINWMGYRATRINTMGRNIGGKWIKGTTRRGTSDLSLTLKGKSVMVEIKIPPDKPSEHQLKEQAKERAAGGIYEFISTPEQFFELFDRVVNN
jgi:hypothetical protein